MRGGFTLVELLTVLVILGLSIGVALPSLSRVVNDQHRRTASDEIADIFRTAARTARERASSVTVTLDSVSPRFWVHGAGDALIEGAASDPLVRFGLTTARMHVMFYPGGGSSGGSIPVLGVGGSERVYVDPWTAHVIVHR